MLSGHLFLTGGMTAEEKSERDLQMGNLGSLELELLPPADYYALGHLHKPQTVGGNDCCRYSGAPIMMGFGEIGQVKSVALIDLAPGKAPAVRLESVPQTQLLVQLKGTPEDIDRKLTDLVAAGRSAWVDIQVNEGIGDLTPWWNVFSTIAEGSSVRLLRWQNARPGKTGSLLAAAIANEARLEHLTPEELFEMRIKDENLTAGEKDEFTAMFKEILQAVAEADANKE